MYKIKLIIVQLAMLTISGCYQWKGELNSRIEDVSLMPGGNIVAIGILENYKRYPLLNFSGWSRGVPRTYGRKVRIYYYNIQKREITEKAFINYPRGWDHQNNLDIHIWDNDGGLFLKLEGCPKSNQNCKEANYYHLSKSGEVANINELPKVTKEYMESLHGNVAVIAYEVENNELKINVGHSGAWKFVLVYKDHKLIPAYDNNAK